MPKRSEPPPADSSAFRPIDKFRLGDLEALRLVLRGGSVIDWHRLNFSGEDEAADFIHAQEIDLNVESDRERAENVKQDAIDYLRRHFDFPIPRPVASLDLPGLLMLAAGKGHRQLCACTILKVMHIIHHLEGRELLYMLPVADQEMFFLVEEKVYRVIGGMLAQGFPILEFIGGRKHKDSLYTKLLSKPDTIAANIYDKLRFRIVTRSPDDIFPVVSYLLLHVFPFNYDSQGLATREAARGAIKQLFDAGVLSEGDSVIITSGDHMELHGATNTLRLLKVGPGGRAEGLGEL